MTDNREKAGGRKTIIEFKARCDNPDRIREIVKSLDPRMAGTDRQVDTYFNVPNGRLKLRQGTIENNLIFYNRPDGAAPKQSDVNLYKPASSPELLALLTTAFSIDVQVVKTREIYFIQNVKIHIDDVDGLGSFVEVEAIDSDGTLDVEILSAQCDRFLRLFDIAPDSLVAVSYSDLLRAS